MDTKLKISKQSPYYLAIFLVLVLEHDCFYLISQEWSVFGLGISDFCILLELALLVSAILSGGGGIPKSKYNWFILSALFLVVTSAVAGFLTYGQGILAGIIVQRNRIAGLLFFFPLLYWYRNRKITAEGILKTIGVFLFIYMGVCIFQYVLSDVIIFLQAGGNASNIRYGSVRFWFSGAFLVLYSAFSVDKFFKNKRKKLKPVLIILFAMIFFFIISRGRMAAIAFTGTIAITMILHRGSAKMKIAGIAAVVIGGFILASTEMGEDLLNILIGGVSSQGDTLTVRQMGRDYYVEQTCADPLKFLFGCGYASGHNGMARSMTFPNIFSGVYGYAVTLYPEDNGIFGIFYYYGFSGIVWWIAALGFSFANGKRIYKKTGEFAYIFRLIYDVIACLTLYPFMLGGTTVAAFYWILMMDAESKLIKEER